MSRPSRSSLSASTPDSLSDNESSMGPASAAAGRYTPRKPSYTPNRTGLTPGGSRNGSKPNSRPASRAGSKPPSRHGSNLSLDSTGIIQKHNDPSKVQLIRLFIVYFTPMQMIRHHLEFRNDDLQAHRHRSVRRRVHHVCRLVLIKLPRSTVTMACRLLVVPYLDREHRLGQPVQHPQGL